MDISYPKAFLSLLAQESIVRTKDGPSSRSRREGTKECPSDVLLKGGR
jgi:hypothetical protein